MIMETNNTESVTTTTGDNDIDPFKVRLKFTTYDYLKMCFLGVTILPFRIIGKSSFLLLLKSTVASYVMFHLRNVLLLYHSLGVGKYWNDR